MRKKRIYVAGPMRGIPKYNFPAFFEAEKFLTELGWEVVSPARMDCLIDGLDPDDPHPDESLGIDYYMARDLPAVRSCDAIAMLPGWEASTGANRELAEAIKYEREVHIVMQRNGCLYMETAYDIVPDPAKLAPEGGINLSAGKLRVQLVPVSSEIAIATILDENAKPRGKYEPRNWEKGMPWMECYGSARRHILAWLQGEYLDPESHRPHLWHILCRFAMLVEYERTGKGTDDRPGKEAA